MDKQLLKEINQLHAEICGGLADPKRIALLYAIADEPQTVTQLASALDVPQPTVSLHLKILRDHGMAIAKRDGVNTCYASVDKRIIRALDLLREVLSDHLAKRSALAEAMS